MKHIFNPESLYFKKGANIKKSFKIKNKFIKQKKTTYFAPNGAAIYITSKKNIRKFILGGKKIIGYTMKFINSIDIDDKEDLKLAKLFFK